MEAVPACKTTCRATLVLQLAISLLKQGKCSSQAEDFGEMICPICATIYMYNISLEHVPKRSLPRSSSAGGPPFPLIARMERSAAHGCRASQIRLVCLVASASVVRVTRPIRAEKAPFGAPVSFPRFSVTV